MKSAEKSTGPQDISLNFPVNAQFNFTVTISQASNLQSGHTFTVTGKDISNKKNTRIYSLPDRSHDSYLTFFEQLATDFGLRVPLNRRPVTYKSSFKAEYREVLIENIHAEILYGYGDPAVIRVEISPDSFCYYLIATSNDASNSFPILRSENLVDWKPAGFIFPQGNKPDWATDGELVSDYWAPEMHNVANEYRVYFVARNKSTTELCIGVARSMHPEGPYTSDKEPLLTGNVIDPHLYVEDNTSFLFWKEDNNDVWPGLLVELLHNNPGYIPKLFPVKEDQLTISFVTTLFPWIKTLGPMERFLAQQVFIEAVIERYNDFYNSLKELSSGEPEEMRQAIGEILKFMKTPIYAQKLSDDGSGFTGERTKIIENDLAWESHLIEGMWLSKQGEKYYLFYAGNDFSTEHYGIGVAIADSLLGPFKKMPQQLLRSTEKWLAPGHPSVALSPTGEPTMFLHAYFPGRAGYKQFRALLSIPLVFENDSVFLKY